MTAPPRTRKAAERLFVAVELPVEARDALAAALPASLPGRRVPADKWHFTLQFLGDTAASVRDALIRELQLENFGESFTARLTGLGAFPRAKHARVLWIGVDSGADELRALAAKVAAACARVVMRADERPYSPHLTLTRMDPPRDVRDLIADTRLPAVQALVSEVLLMRSESGQGAPRYTPLARFPLRTGE